MISSRHRIPITPGTNCRKTELKRHGQRLNFKKQVQKTEQYQRLKLMKSRHS
ncbi:hypothetical protein MC7420_3174 [Coleofasciculus chthonoplastes PCC 7420]|uniref:Uncharacterized protein n=1 Tax=Coleofasciculus chthonoplastes PCC 7420 TaxID=118168 RepID=B4VJR1_9CYAN|nr:hypothetical protein MC7420_3174 [Coleofasciculus chthonoplastes PCC 7420]